MTLALGIEDRSARIVIAEPAASARQLLGAVMQELGFRNISSMDSVQAALDYLAQEDADYVICSLSMDTHPTALHLVRTLRGEPALQHIPVAVFVGEEEGSALPTMFEFGLVSWHPRIFSREAVTSELKELVRVLAQSGYHTPTVANHYLTRFYLEQELFDTARSQIEHFLTFFPDSRLGRLDLADSMLAGGDMENGKALLGQFKALAFSGWEVLAKRYFSSEDDVPAQIGFTPCLVVDSDETVHNNLSRLFEQFPEFRIVPFTSGIAADEWCRENGRPGLIIQEWKCRDLPGAAFLQRIRPVIVLSSLVTKKDSPLLKEMGVTEVFEKPVIKEAFVESLVFALIQEKDPTDLSILERKISSMLNMGHAEYAQFLKSRIDNHPKASPGNKMYIDSLFFFYRGCYHDAKSTAMAAVQSGGDPLKCLTVLARSLVRLRDFDGAVKCFERARSLSPDNVERLCELADVLADLGRFDRADAALDNARKIDQTNDLVRVAESKVAIKSGDPERARRIIEHMSQVSGLVSEMNNSAVALVKVGQFEQAVSLYRHTIEALPEELAETRAKVSYNLALAFARKGSLKESLAELEGLELPEGTSVGAKISSLRIKVKQSLETKRPLKLVSDHDEEALSSGGEIDSMGVGQDRPAHVMESGQAGLFGLYEASPEERRVTTRALEREVKFVRRLSALSA
jgi:DNA-binding response OmpR family regulator